MYIVGTYIYIYTHTYILAHVVEATLTHHHLLVQYTFCCWIKPFNANSHGSRMGSHSPHMCHLNTSQSILGGHTVFNPYQFIVPLYNTPMLKMSKHPPLRDFLPPILLLLYNCQGPWSLENHRTFAGGFSSKPCLMAPEGNKLNDLQGTTPVSHIAELVQVARKKRVDCWPYSDKTTRSLEYVGVINQLLININILMGSILKPYPPVSHGGFRSIPISQHHRWAEP